MILFQKDWDEYPTAIVDDTCVNRTFLDYALLLKEMGVKNYLWPLALFQPELKGVDPFDPNLSKEQVMMLVAEFKANPFAYFRMCARIPGSTRNNPLYFRADRANMSTYWLYFNHITNSKVQPRQTGKTHGVAQLDVYLTNVKSRDGRTLLLTKDDGLRAKTLKELESVMETMPFYLRQHTKKDVMNREEFKVSSLDNEYKGLVARSSAADADKVGRGHTVENPRFDEFAYLVNIDISMSVVMAATTAARARAEAMGNPYGDIFMTTAGKKDEREGEYAYNYIHDSAPWSEFFMDARDETDLRNLIRTASRDGKTLRVNSTFSHRQLGYTDEWLEEVTRNANSTGAAKDRDYLNIWTSGTTLSPLSVETAQRIRGSQSEVRFGEISKHGSIFFRWYIPEDQIDQYISKTYVVLSGDTSDAVGRDDIGLVITDLRDGAVLGAATINEINLFTGSHYLVDMLIRFPTMTMILERRSSGSSIYDFVHRLLISKNQNPFVRLFNFCVQDYDQYPERYKLISDERNARNEQFLAKNKKTFGFSTSGGGVTSRDDLYGTTLNSAGRYTGHLVRDKPLIDQILSLVVRNGRIDHQTGGHDDLCIAWLLGHWFMTMGRNLQHYGIPSGYVLSTNQVVHSRENKELQEKANHQKKVRDWLDQAFEIAEEEHDRFVLEKMYAEITRVVKMLEDDSSYSASIDELINKLKTKSRVMMGYKQSIFR